MNGEFWGRGRAPSGSDGVEERGGGRATVLVAGDMKMMGKLMEGGDGEIGVGDTDDVFEGRLRFL